MTFEEKVNALYDMIFKNGEPSAAAVIGGNKPATPEAMIWDILMELGAPDHLKGHPYVVKAIELVLQDRCYIENITGRLYPTLAAMFDTTSSRVERAIRHLIEAIWQRSSLDVLDKYFRNTVDPRKGKTTNGEFIARMANVVSQRLN